MRSPINIKRIFTFNKIVGYATVLGSLATVYGVIRVNSLTVKLEPVVKVFQNGQHEIQGQTPIIIRDTIIYKDTIICRDTVSYRDTITIKDTVRLSSDDDLSRINALEHTFRETHGLSNSHTLN